MGVPLLFQESPIEPTKIWLVVWNMNFGFPFSWQFHHPNGRAHIFQKGWLNQQPAVACKVRKARKDAICVPKYTLKWIMNVNRMLDGTNHFWVSICGFPHSWTPPMKYTILESYTILTLYMWVGRNPNQSQHVCWINPQYILSGILT